MSDAPTKTNPEALEPSVDSLEEMPAIDPSKHRRRPGRGRKYDWIGRGLSKRGRAGASGSASKPLLGYRPPLVGGEHG